LNLEDVSLAEEAIVNAVGACNKESHIHVKYYVAKRFDLDRQES